MIAFSRVLAPSQGNNTEPLKVSAITAGKAPVGWEYLKEFPVRNKSPRGEVPRTKGVKRGQKTAEGEAGKREGRIPKKRLSSFLAQTQLTMCEGRREGKTSQVSLAS